MNEDIKPPYASSVPRPPLHHNHSYQFGQLKKDFEPLENGDYRLTEYVYSVCYKCGDVTKSKPKEQ